MKVSVSDSGSFDHKKKIIHRAILAFAILTLLLFSTGSHNFQYESVDNLEFSGGFPGAASMWKIHGPMENVVIAETSIQVRRRQAGYSSAYKFISRPEKVIAGTIVRVVVEGHIRFRLPAEPIRKTSDLGDKRQTEPLIVLQMYDENAARLRVSHIGRLPGKSADFSIERILKLPEKTDRIAVGFLLRQAEADLTVVDASIELVKHRKLYQVFTVMLIFSVIAWFLYCLLKLIPFLTLKFTLLGVLLLTVTGVLLTTSTNTLSKLLSTQYPALSGVAAELDPNQSDILSNSLHVVLFTLVGGYLCALIHTIRLSLGYALLCSLLVAAAAEIVQFHMASRTMSFTDFSYNVVGVALGVCFYLLVQWRINDAGISRD